MADALSWLHCSALASKFQKYTVYRTCALFLTTHSLRDWRWQLTEEPGTGGLHYARLEEYHDLPLPLPPADAPAGSASAANEARDLIAECRILIE